jgi:hypothetical protein
MKLLIALPDDADQVSLVARFNAPAVHKTMVILVELQLPDGSAIRTADIGWSEALASNYVYCPDVSAPGFMTLATLTVPDGVCAMTVNAQPWRSESSVLGSLDGFHACVSLNEAALKMTCAGVEQ